MAAVEERREVNPFCLFALQNWNMLRAYAPLMRSKAGNQVAWDQMSHSVFRLDPNSLHILGKLRSLL